MLLKSPVSRFGGKYYLVDWLNLYLAGHTVYVEPFCGAGHLLFTKPPSRVEVLNDVDNYLVDFFKVIQEPDKRQMLIERLNYMPYSRSLWNEIRSQWKAGILPQDEIERSTQWFFSISHVFQATRSGAGLLYLLPLAGIQRKATITLLITLIPSCIHT